MLRACRPGTCAACKAVWENKDRPPRGGGGGPWEASLRRALGGGPSEAGPRRAFGGGPSNFWLFQFGLLEEEEEEEGEGEEEEEEAAVIFRIFIISAKFQKIYF